MEIKKQENNFKNWYAACQILKQVPKIEKRQYLKHIQVVDEIAYATNTKTLLAFNVEIPEGWYIIKRCTKATIEMSQGILNDYRHPDYEKLLNQVGDCTENMVNIYNCADTLMYDLYDITNRKFCKKDMDISILVFENEEVREKHENHKPNTHVVLSSGDTRMAIMPFVSL